MTQTMLPRKVEYNVGAATGSARLRNQQRSVVAVSRKGGPVTFALGGYPSVEESPQLFLWTRIQRLEFANALFISFSSGTYRLADLSMVRPTGFLAFFGAAPGLATTPALVE